VAPLERAGPNSIGIDLGLSSLALAQREAIADTELSSVKSGACSKAREAVASGEECLEGLITAPQHLLLGREGPTREFWRGASHGLQFVGLHRVRDRNTLPAIGLDTLL
jgi:hypothetical protein